MPRFYLTTAIDYVNNRPHLGTAYEKVAADVIARYRRLAGFDVRFVMGNDEHSQNVFRKARETGLDPLAYCDRMEGEFRQVWDRLHLSFDDFIRTTAAAPSRRRAEDGPAVVRRGRHLRRPLRRLVLRLVRVVQAGEGPGRRALPDPPVEAGLDQGTELLLPAVEVSRRARPSLRRAPGVRRAGVAPQRDAPRCSTAASTTSRSAARDRPGAFRCRSSRRASSTSGTTR